MIKVHFFFDLMNLDILVPHREHLPANLLLPFFFFFFFYVGHTSLLFISDAVTDVF